MSASPTVVVTGANGLVGAAVCRELLGAGAQVRAVVRRAGAAPEGTTEIVGDFYDPAIAKRACQGATAVVSTAHPLGGDEQTQRSVAVTGTPVLAQAAKDAGVGVFVHISTAAVYARTPGTGDVDEESPLVGDDDGTYMVSKRDTDAALAQVGGPPLVLLRPPAILGDAPSSIWNRHQPEQARTDESARRDNPERTFAWVHVDDLARLAAELATGTPATGAPPAEPVTVLNVAAPRATARDYVGTICAAVGVEPEWTDGPVWTGTILADRARALGWEPRVTLEQALAEIRAGLQP